MASIAAVQLKIKTRDGLHRILLAAVQDRRQRPGVLTTPHGPDTEWGVHERQVMLDSVNTIRRRHGKDPVDMASIEGADRQAAGHIDWSTKFALFCAEIALR